MGKNLVAATCLAALALVALSTWSPADFGNSGTPVVAQEKDRQPADHHAPARSAEVQRSQAEDALRTRLNFDYVDMPLDDALAHLCGEVELQYYLNTRSLEDIGISGDAVVSLRLAGVSLELGLDLMLEQLDLTYVIRDGVILVTTEEALEFAEEVRVYNCRDLLGTGTAPQDLADVGAAVEPADNTDASAPAPADQSTRDSNAPQEGGTAKATDQGKVPPISVDVLAQFGGGGGMSGGLGSTPQPAPVATPNMQLINLITTAVAPDSWEAVGGPGTISDFDGLIVVRQNPRVHRQVAEVLSMLRKASDERQWANPADGLGGRRPPISPDMQGIGGGGGGGGFF